MPCYLKYSENENAFIYRVTIPLVQNFLLTSKEKFHFGLACPGMARPKRNFSFEVNGRF